MIEESDIKNTCGSFWSLGNGKLTQVVIKYYTFLFILICNFTWR